MREYKTICCFFLEYFDAGDYDGLWCTARSQQFAKQRGIAPPVCTTDQQIPEQEDKNPVVTKDTEQTSEQTSVQTIDPDLTYSELVERFRALVSDPFGQDGDNPGEMGVLEAARAAGDNAV